MSRALPNGWSETTIAEVASINPRSFDLPPDAEDLVSFVPMAAVEEESGRMDATRHRPWRDVQKGYTRFQDGDVVFAKITPCMENGKFALATGLHGGRAAGTTEVHVLRPTAALSARFLLHFLLQESIRAAAQRAMRGAAGQLRVPPEFLRDLTLPLPPIAEQHRIVAAIEEHLTKLDAAAAALERARANARQYRAALLSTLLDGETLNAYQPERLGDLLAEPLRNGHSAKKAAGTGVRTLTLTAVTERDFSDKNTKLTEADATRVDDLWLRPGDIFVERGNTPELVGTAALYDGPERYAIFPDLLIRVRVCDRLLPRYLDYVLRTHRARTHFRSRAQGIAGSMPKIDQTVVASLPIRVPPLDKQFAVLDELDSAFLVVDRLEAQIDVERRRSERLRQSILKRAFEGKLVPQEPNDEPASALLDRIRTASTVSRPSPTRPAAVRSRSGRR